MLSFFFTYFKGLLLKIESIQIALFFRNIMLDRPDLKFRTLIDNFNDVFDAMPTQFDLPQGTPNDVPFMILKSTNNLTSCNVSRTRIDFITEDINYVENQDKLLKFIEDVSNVIEIKNFGFVTTHFEKDENASKIIVNDYFKFKNENLQEVALKFNNPIKLNKETYNYHITINDVKQTNIHTKDKREGLLIQKDINNISTNIKNEIFTTSKLQSLFKSAQQNLYSSKVDV